LDDEKNIRQNMLRASQFGLRIEKLVLFFTEIVLCGLVWIYKAMQITDVDAQETMAATNKIEQIVVALRLEPCTSAENIEFAAAANVQRFERFAVCRLFPQQRTV
jgi:hypothetical protein